MLLKIVNCMLSETVTICFQDAFLLFLFSEKTVHSSNVCPKKVGGGLIVYF